MNPQPIPPRDTVLAVHPSASTGRAWDRMAAALRARFTVRCPDRAGCGGEAGWPVGLPCNLDDEAEHLAPLLASPGAQGVHLLAQSYGGAVALRLALRWSQRVKSLTLYEPMPLALLRTHDDDSSARELLQMGRTLSLWVLSGQLHKAAQRFIDFWSGPGTWQALEPRRQDAVARQMPKVRAEFGAAIADRTPLAAYRRLTMPVRLLVGGCSSVAVPARRIADALAEQMPRAEVVVVPGAGHMGPQTHAADVLAQLPAFLQPKADALYGEMLAA